MKKLLLLFTLSLVLLSCEKEDGFGDMSNFMFTIDEINVNSAKVHFTGLTEIIDSGTLFYKEGDGVTKEIAIKSNDQTINIIQDLKHDTEYKVWICFVKGSNEWISQVRKIKTKSYEFSQWSLMPEKGSYNSFDLTIFSFPGKEHMITTKNLLTPEDVKVYFVSESLLDSIEVSVRFANDTLCFTMPEIEISQEPRVDHVDAYISIHIGSFHSYLNDSHLRKSDGFRAQKFRLYNKKPYINKVKVEQSTIKLDRVIITMDGDFLTKGDFYDRSPYRADASIYKADGTHYADVSYVYGKKLDYETSYFVIFDRGLGYYMTYHIIDCVAIGYDGMPSGDYSAQIFFTFEDGRHAETNIMDFTVEAQQ